MATRRHLRWSTALLATPITVAAIAGIAGCGGGTGAPGGLTAEQKQGYEIARTNGCFACHGTAGRGGVSPTWVGMYGSTVKLADGSSVVADEAYLIESITNPSAKVVEGAKVAMPPNGLSADQVRAVVAYIMSLGG